MKLFDEINGNWLSTTHNHFRDFDESIKKQIEVDLRNGIQREDIKEGLMNKHLVGTAELSLDKIDHQKSKEALEIIIPFVGDSKYLRIDIGGKTIEEKKCSEVFVESKKLIFQIDYLEEPDKAILEIQKRIRLLEKYIPMAEEQRVIINKKIEGTIDKYISDMEKRIGHFAKLDEYLDNL
ncbi:hypothetical protein RI065_00735 [Mycoplasmatota bacterium zrk1]